MSSSLDVETHTDQDGDKIGLQHSRSGNTTDAQDTTSVGTHDLCVRLLYPPDALTFDVTDALSI